MAKIPGWNERKNSTVNQLDKIEIVDEDDRDYLGLSSIGELCLTKIWLNWRLASKKVFPKRIKRIFERGDIEEARFIRDLKEIGVECFRRDEDGNKIEIFGKVDEEQETIIGTAGHAKGHPDGRCLNLPEAPKTEHLLEFKTMAEKYFNLFKTKTLIVSHPKYYAQVQRYMKGMKLERTALLARNKNTEETHLERIKIEKDYVETLIAKESHIILSELPPTVKFKLNSFECRFCNHKPICHEGATPERNCRTCKSADLYDDGKWVCSFKDKSLTFEEQKKGCDHYRRLF